VGVDARAARVIASGASDRRLRDRDRSVLGGAPCDLGWIA